jgi:hypothetical protein
MRTIPIHEAGVAQAIKVSAATSAVQQETVVVVMRVVLQTQAIRASKAYVALRAQQQPVMAFAAGARAMNRGTVASPRVIYVAANVALH